MKKWWESKWVEAISYVLVFGLLLVTISKGGILDLVSAKAMAQDQPGRVLGVDQSGRPIGLTLRVNGQDFPVAGSNLIEFRTNSDLMLNVQRGKDGHLIVDLDFAYWNVDRHTQQLINQELDRRMQAAPGGVSPPR